MRKILGALLLLGSLAVISMPSADTAVAAPSTGKLLASGLQGTIGSTIGPDGALYVAEGAAGKISRVDLQTGDVTTFASGLPKAIPGLPTGGAMDVAFIGGTAYALVTLVGPDVGGGDTVGIYRVDGPSSVTVIADIGEWSKGHPPKPAFGVPTGVQYAFEVFDGGFLVTDGHHNRMLKVSLDGKISELIALENIVPTGLSIVGTTVYMAEAGPVPHKPEDGRLLAFDPDSPRANVIAAGASLLVDVERGYAGQIYALSQGPAVPGAAEGSPAQPNTGALVKLSGDGTLSVVVEGLDRPTSVEFVGDTAFVLTITGEVWKIDNVSKLSAIPSSRPAVTPPSAGDGGLLDPASGNLMTLVVVVFVTLGAAALVRRGRLTW